MSLNQNIVLTHLLSIVCSTRSTIQKYQTVECFSREIASNSGKNKNKQNKTHNQKIKPLRYLSFSNLTFILTSFYLSSVIILWFFCKSIKILICINVGDGVCTHNAPVESKETFQESVLSTHLRTEESNSGHQVWVSETSYPLNHFARPTIKSSIDIEHCAMWKFNECLYIIYKYSNIISIFLNICHFPMESGEKRGWEAP